MPNLPWHNVEKGNKWLRTPRMLEWICYVCSHFSMALPERVLKTLAKKCLCWRGSGALDTLLASLRCQLQGGGGTTMEEG